MLSIDRDIGLLVSLILSHWILIYPVDSIIQHLNYWGTFAEMKACFVELTFCKIVSSTMHSSSPNGPTPFFSTVKISS